MDKVIRYNFDIVFAGEKPSFYIDRPTFDSLGIPKHDLMVEGWYYQLFDKAEKDKVYSIRLDEYCADYKIILQAIEYLTQNGYTLSEEVALKVRKIKEYLEKVKKREESQRLEEERKKQQEQVKTVLLCRKYGCEMKSVLECIGCKRKDYEECLPERIKIKK